MAKKSNKTAHVLNLLTTNDAGNADGENANETGIEPEASSAADSAAAKPADQKKQAQTIEIENDASDPLSSLLRDELEKQYNVSTQQDGTVGELMFDSNHSEKGNDQMEGNEVNMQMNQPEDDPSSYVSVNIVEDIVKNKAHEFMKKMGGCTCHRCLSDVVAMTLNILPPKYIVTQKGMLFAKIESYENQYSTDVSSALTKTCLMVKNNPKH